MRVVIVGAGQAAAAAARSLRENGHRGSVVVVGDEPIAPYERPPLSKQWLQEDLPSPAHFAPDDWWRDQDVHLRLGERVESFDRGEKVVMLRGGISIPYDALILATGGRARTLGVGATLRTAEDARLLGLAFAASQSVCVIGGGFLGLEIAASARARGREVTVVEAGPRLLGNVLPAEMSDWLARLHAEHGTTVLCGAAVSEAVKLDGGRYRIRVGAVDVMADCLVEAVGMVPNTELAEAAGLHVAAGIVVDASCVTSDPCVYAVGDVASRADPVSGRVVRIESWQNAELQGDAVARSILGLPAADRPVSWFWTEQYGHSIQVLGDVRACDTLIWRGSYPVAPFVGVGLRSGRVVGGIGVNAGKELPPLRQLVAAQAEVGAEDVLQARSLRDVLAAARRPA